MPPRKRTSSNLAIAASAPSTSKPSAMPTAGHNATNASTQAGAQRQPYAGTAATRATAGAPGSMDAGVIGKFLVQR